MRLHHQRLTGTATSVFFGRYVSLFCFVMVLTIVLLCSFNSTYLIPLFFFVLAIGFEIYHSRLHLEEKKEKKRKKID